MRTSLPVPSPTDIKLATRDLQTLLDRDRVTTPIVYAALQATNDPGPHLDYVSRTFYGLPVKDLNRIQLGQLLGRLHRASNPQTLHLHRVTPHTSHNVVYRIAQGDLAERSYYYDRILHALYELTGTTHITSHKVFVHARAEDNPNPHLKRFFLTHRKTPWEDMNQASVARVLSHLDRETRSNPTSQLQRTKAIPGQSMEWKILHHKINHSPTHTEQRT